MSLSLRRVLLAAAVAASAAAPAGNSTHRAMCWLATPTGAAVLPPPGGMWAEWTHHTAATPFRRTFTTHGLSIRATTLTREGAWLMDLLVSFDGNASTRISVLGHGCMARAWKGCRRYDVEVLALSPKPMSVSVASGRPCRPTRPPQ